MGIALNQMGKNVVASEQLKLDREKFTEQKRANQITAKLNQTIADAQLQQLKINQGIFVTENIEGVLQDRKDLTPAEKNSWAKIISNVTGYSPEVVDGLFTPADMKGGETSLFSFKSGGGLSRDLKNKEQENINRIKTAEAVKQEIENKVGGPNLMMAGANKLVESPQYKAATPYEQAVMMADYHNKFATQSTIIPLEKGTRKDIEEMMYSMAKQSASLHTIADNYADAFLTYFGKAKGWSLDKIIKGGFEISDKNKAFVGGGTLFYQAVNRMHQQYVHDMSGAQFSIKEMDRYKQAMFNKDLNSVAFKASFKQYISDVQKSYRMHKMYLQGGFPNVLSLPEFDKYLEGMLISKGDPTLTETNISKRGEEIHAVLDEMNPEASAEAIEIGVDAQLIKEGYMEGNLVPSRGGQ